MTFFYISQSRKKIMYIIYGLYIINRSIITIHNHVFFFNNMQNSGSTTCVYYLILLSHVQRASQEYISAYNLVIMYVLVVNYYNFEKTIKVISLEHACWQVGVVIVFLFLVRDTVPANTTLKVLV